MLHITNLPTDIILDCIIPLLSVRDFLSLAATCKAFHVFSTDEVYWKSKVTKTFRLPSQPIRETGWKELFQKMACAKVYTWGSTEKGRLGHSYSQHKITLPTLVPELEGHIVVDIVAGGWSTTVLTDKGDLYSTGALNNSTYGSHTFQKLEFPPGFENTKIQQVSSGRSHVLGLDDDGRIWIWNEISIPGRIVKFFNVETKAARQCERSGSIRGMVKTVVAGWDHSAAHIHGVGIVVWGEVSVQRQQVQRGGGQIDIEDAIIVDGELVPYTGYVEKDSPAALDTDDRKISKDVGEVLGMMAGESFLVFVTTSGKVFCIASGFSATITVTPPTQLTAFAAPEGEQPMSYVAGNFRGFAVFNKSGSVFIGSKNTVDEAIAAARHSISPTQGADSATDPTIMESLQHKNIVKVAFGDYHCLALTAEGKMLSWGTEPRWCGCLGLGDEGVARTRGVTNRNWNGVLSDATEIRFDLPPAESVALRALSHECRAKYFVFNIAAAGWHSGALVTVPENARINRPEDEETEATEPFLGRPVGSRTRAPGEVSHRDHNLPQRDIIPPAGYTPFIQTGPPPPQPGAVPTLPLRTPPVFRRVVGTSSSEGSGSSSSQAEPNPHSHNNADDEQSGTGGSAEGSGNSRGPRCSAM